jgi:hypothetical protein
MVIRPGAAEIKRVGQEGMKSETSGVDDDNEPVMAYGVVVREEWWRGRH